MAEQRETPKAASAFTEYCALGSARSLRKLAESNQKYSKSIALLMKWSSQHDWQERVKQYDQERAEEKRAKYEADIEEMNERHALLAIDAQSTAIAQIQALIAAKSFGSQASVQLLKIGLDAERLARGAPTERSEQTGPGGTSLPAAQVTIWIPDNGRDGYVKGGDIN